MALTEFELKRCEKLAGEFVEKRRPPAHIRNELDFGFRIEGQSVVILEIRPMWRNPDKMLEMEVAKATYVKSRKIWKVYWKRADQKWHRYDRDYVFRRIEDFLLVVDRDEYGCFFG